MFNSIGGDMKRLLIIAVLSCLINNLILPQKVGEAFVISYNNIQLPINRTGVLAIENETLEENQTYELP